MRATASFLLSLLLGSCTSITHLRNPKTGETATCGGAIWTPTASARDEHCLKYFHQQGFDAVP